ncbi:MAG: hypothetical protein ACUVV3_10570, partial [Dehalococcoidia bacterium]
RAFLQAARRMEERGNLDGALELYRQALELAQSDPALGSMAREIELTIQEVERQRRAAAVPVRPVVPAAPEVRVVQPVQPLTAKEVWPVAPVRPPFAEEVRPQRKRGWVWVVGLAGLVGLLMLAAAGFGLWVWNAQQQELARQAALATAVASGYATAQALEVAEARTHATATAQALEMAAARTQATATAQAQATATAQARATATAQARATAAARTRATATAQALPTSTPTRTPRPTLVPTPSPVGPAATPPSGSEAARGWLDFERELTWRRGDQPYGQFDRSSEVVHSGNFAGRLQYNFPAVNDNFVVFVARPAIPIPGQPTGLSAWVYGNQSGHFLNVWVLDAAGEVRAYTFGRVYHQDWQMMTAWFDDGRGWPNGHISGPDNGVLDLPANLYALVLDGVPDGQASSGVIYIDEVYVTTQPIPQPTPTPEPPPPPPP